MPSSTHSDSSDYDGIGDLFSETGESSNDGMTSVDGQEVLKEPPSIIALPQGVIAWARNHDQGTENRIVDSRTPHEVPSNSGVPSLNRSVETLSFTTHSTNEAMELSIPNPPESRTANFPYHSNMPPASINSTTDVGDHHSGDNLSQSSADPSPDGSRSVSPIRMDSTSASSLEDSDYTDRDDEDYIPSFDESVEEVLIPDFDAHHLADSPRMNSDQEEIESGEYADSPPVETESKTAPINNKTPPALNDSSVGDRTVEPTNGEAKRRRNLDNGEGDSDSDREESIKNKSKRLKLDEDANFRLACPFYKLDPVRHRHCYAAVLKRNSIVKQHLYRSHMQPPYCNICLERLPNGGALRDHLREQKCQKRDYVPPDGITPEQERRLRSRLRVQSRSKTEQWFDIYEILFPGAQKPTSPYLDNDLSEDMESFREFIARQGPAIFCQELEKRQTSFSALSSEQMRSLDECFQGASSTVFNQWQDQRRGHICRD